MTSEATDKPTTTTNLTSHFTSNWTFPAAINNTFITQWLNDTLQTEHAETDGQMILRAVKEVPLPSTWNFGSPTVEVHVNDVIEPDWQGGDPRSVKLSCILCSSGRKEGCTEGNGIFDACANYTDTFHVSQFQTTVEDMAPNSAYTIPSLSQTLLLPNTTVGLCVMLLSNVDGGFSLDYTLPFPILQAPRHPHYRFSFEDTSGLEDPSIPDPSAPTTTPLYTGGSKSTNGGKGASMGLIAGVVVSVLMSVAFVALMGYWLWRRNSMQKKPASIPLVPRNGSTQNTVLTYRHEDNDGEVPPAYHEVVRESAAEQCQIDPNLPT